MPAATLVSAEQLGAATLATAPEPTPGMAPAESAAAPKNPPPPAANYAGGLGKDRDGVEFDPVKHLPEKDGNRRWKKIQPGKRGRPPGSSSAEKWPDDGTPAGHSPFGKGNVGLAGASYVAPDPAPAPVADKYDLAADMYCRAFYSVAGSVFAAGDEWVPDNDGEHEGLSKAAAAYMRAKGMDDLPPGPALALAVGTYAAKRITRPKTATRWRMIVAYWKAKYAAWRTGRKIDRLDPVGAPQATG